MKNGSDVASDWEIDMVCVFEVTSEAQIDSKFYLGIEFGRAMVFL